MNYLIKKRTIRAHNSLRISVEQFDQLLDARTGLVEILNIEEKFNIVLENYADFERVLVNSSLDRVLFSGHDWSASMSELNRINRALVNLLSTCRLYIDQIPQNISDAFKNDPTPVEAIRNQMRDEYDNHLGYRVLEALRNYSQHRSLPLHGFGRGMRIVDRDDRRLVAHYLTTSIDVTRLEEDQHFKRQILHELKALDDRYFDVKPFVREYMEGLMRVHGVFREIVAHAAQRWEASFLSTLEQYRQTFGEDTSTLAAYATDDADERVEEVPIFDELIKRREWLVRKNEVVKNLGSHFVTTEMEATLSKEPVRRL